MQVNERKSIIIPRTKYGTVNFLKDKIKVAAYARVSTDREEQEDSFERQVDYYTRYINNKNEWDFVGIYADPGITGTQAEKRPQFLKMINDAVSGKINKIIVKSIARFARNTEEALKYIRILKEAGVGVYFETNNQDTSEPGGEIMITILAAMAEEESRTISKNVTWAMDKKFEKGDMMLNYSRFLGYTKNENGELVIVPEEAEIVKRIYREYIGGKSINAIANGLDVDNISTPSNGKKWYKTVIVSILTNEKYIGTALMNKTYKRDVLSKKREKNTGQKKMYLVENHHPAIISKETFELVQALISERKITEGYSNSNKGRYSSKYPFSKKIKCGECGNYYRRHAQTVKGEYVQTWVCAEHKLNKDKCGQMYITEKAIENAFVEVMKELMQNSDVVKEMLLENINAVLNDNNINELEKIVEKIKKLQTAMINLYKKKIKGELSKENYEKEALIVQKQIDALNNKKAKLEENKSVMILAKSRLEEIEKIINSDINGFDEDTFTNLVDEVIIRKRYELEFKFKCGISKKWLAE